MRALLVDVGNTQTKWASVTARGALRLAGSLATPDFTEPRVAAWAKEHACQSVVVASVVPRITRLLKKHLPDAVIVSGSLPGLPLAFAYPRSAEVGADRLAAVIGARGAGAAIVISCGTATVFSVLDRPGRFCGGTIAPGLETQFRVLHGTTAQLPAVSAAGSKRALGRSTEEAIRAGVLLQFQGGVLETVRRLRREIGPGARVFITGGHARHLRGLPGLERAEFRPLLVFEGLRIIAASLFQP